MVVLADSIKHIVCVLYSFLCYLDLCHQFVKFIILLLFIQNISKIARILCLRESMGWAQPQKGICANYMYELAVGPGCRGSLDEFENKTLYLLQELNATQNIQRILSDNMELMNHNFEPVCNKFYFQRLTRASSRDRLTGLAWPVSEISPYL